MEGTSAQGPLLRRACFPEEVLEHVLGFITSHKDRNVISLVCKAWYHVEAATRQHVFIGNCYSVSPAHLVRRFKNLKSLTVKGKPRFSDFGLVPAYWGAYADPWVSALAEAYPWFEGLHLKRMTVSDECLAKLAYSFPNFKKLVLSTCDGFSTTGLAHIARNCRHLQVLELQECEVGYGEEWLSCFPDSFTSLVSLNFTSCPDVVNVKALERLVSRCMSLKSLKLNGTVTFEQLERLVQKAPQIVDLGTGSFAAPEGPIVKRFETAISKCTELRCLSGFLLVSSRCVPSLFPVCRNLTFLNLSYASSMRSSEMTKLISNCNKLRHLWVLDTLEDKGLQAVASACKDLQELRVFPTETCGQGLASEKGLVAISEGCRNLTSILYFCGKMTNEGLKTVARNSPQLTCFRLCILVPCSPDHVTKEPLDEGFGAIVKSCKDLKRFSLSGLLTDTVFCYIGTYGKQLEMLSLAFAGKSDLGMQKILEGCVNLRKLEIRDSPFGDAALLHNVQKYECMRSLWMSSCNVTVSGAQSLAKVMPSLNVEIMKDDDSEDRAEKLYVYRTIAGHRADAPFFVHTCR
ncbi:hypothetical protein KP509_28G051500 [Ceratopteris richardii]|uniref:F-box domain-containing protein n=1 Tax=Ceratopteris richardii TaxID=49495 RepID=A0A8T2RDZ9_CERRI|nr:hypothetical protein KP509_28G051500 [Ceratopteris richardii]KAH7293998.1 hypothetical protein KP509_28G051500 [Ceratopteris richardii]